MKKNTARALLISVLVLGLFNLIAFVIPFEHTDVMVRVEIRLKSNRRQRDIIVEGSF